MKTQTLKIIMDSGGVKHQIEKLTESVKKLNKEFDTLKKQEISITIVGQDNSLPNLKTKQLIDYIYDFAAIYGEYYHNKDANAIIEKVRQKINLPEEFIQRLQENENI